MVDLPSVSELGFTNMKTDMARRFNTQALGKLGIKNLQKRSYTPETLEAVFEPKGTTVH